MLTVQLKSEAGRISFDGAELTPGIHSITLFPFSGQYWHSRIVLKGDWERHLSSPAQQRVCRRLLAAGQASMAEQGQPA